MTNKNDAGLDRAEAHARFCCGCGGSRARSVLLLHKMGEARRGEREVSVEKMITRKEVNQWIARQLEAEGRAGVDPESLSEWERFNLGMKLLMKRKK